MSKVLVVGGGTLSREMILAARDLGIEVVSVPEWGGDVNVSVMGGDVREALLDDIRNPAKASKFNALVLAATVVDDEGAPLFGVSDIEALQRKNQEVVARIVDVALRVNKLSANAVEAEVKNSETAPKA